MSVSQMDRFSFWEAWDNADWDTFELAYARRFRELTAFLEENRMAHRLATAVAEAAEVPAPAAAE